jgi:Rod binding domain-containing protein
VKIDAVSPSIPLATEKTATAQAHKAADPRLEKAAREMEGVFIRQLVAAAKLGGKSGESGYGAMATDALATGIQQGGGLGLAKRIEDALSATLRPVAHAAAPGAAPLASGAPLSGAPR